MIFFYNLLIEYRTINGTNNNLKNPSWGAIGDHYLRDSEINYADGIDIPSGSHLAGPRNISNLLFGRQNRLQTIQISSMVTFYGQFLAHDITLALGSSKPEDYFPIKIPKCDPTFDVKCMGEQNMSFTRYIVYIDI